MRRWIAIFGGCLLLLAVSAAMSQDTSPVGYQLGGSSSYNLLRLDGPSADDTGAARSAAALDLTVPVPRPRMSPELALSTYLGLAYHQLAELGAYSDSTIIEADLPDTAQHGRYELRRSFQAPKSLAYAAVRFAGDGFVKTNVIVRLLQSEVDHVQKGEGPHTAIVTENYKFAFKGTETLDGQSFYRFQAKPRNKRPGLFKGQILIDATTGHLRRAEGAMVKSPSIFVKKVEFVQDYAAYGQFSLPVHIHSIARTRLFGRAVVDISHQRYQAKTVSELQQTTSSSAGAGGSSN